MSEELRAAAEALAETRPYSKHGQLCPVWTERLRKVRHAVTIAACDCWILADAYRDAAVVQRVLVATPEAPVTSCGCACDCRAEAVEDLWAEAEAALPDNGWLTVGTTTPGLVTIEAMHWPDGESNRSIARAFKMPMREAIISIRDQLLAYRQVYVAPLVVDGVRIDRPESPA